MNRFQKNCGMFYISWLVVSNIFPIMYGIILPIDFYIVQRGRSTANQFFHGAGSRLNLDPKTDSVEEDGSSCGCQHVLHFFLVFVCLDLGIVSWRVFVFSFRAPTQITPNSTTALAWRYVGVRVLNHKCTVWKNILWDNCAVLTSISRKILAKLENAAENPR